MRSRSTVCVAIVYNKTNDNSNTNDANNNANNNDNNINNFDTFSEWGRGCPVCKRGEVLLTEMLLPRILDRELFCLLSIRGTT